MKKMKYKPNPIDTSYIELSPDLLKLTELLSKNTHENWAKARINHGWSYGPHRDDDKRETPCLIPYEDLPESEKDYDRILTLNLLKAIIKLGFEIKKTSGV